jgi:hypothetical protein
MYIVIQENPPKVTTFETKTDLSAYLNIHRNTIQNRFDKDFSWVTDKGTVYESKKHYKRVRGGNFDNMETKTLKKNREIPCKNPKLNKGYMN